MLKVYSDVEDGWAIEVSLKRTLEGCDQPAIITLHNKMYLFTPRIFPIDSSLVRDTLDVDEDTSA